jgi:hypothetical protein
MAHPLHDREDFERLDASLAEVLAAAAPQGEGEADAALRARAEAFAAARPAYCEPDAAVADVMLELGAAEEGRPVSAAAVCAALRPLVSVGARPPRPCSAAACAAAAAAAAAAPGASS